MYFDINLPTFQRKVLLPFYNKKKKKGGGGGGGGGEEGDEEEEEEEERGGGGNGGNTYLRTAYKHLLHYTAPHAGRLHSSQSPYGKP
jgi:hypothetical protein